LRRACVTALLIVTPLGFATKSYPGPGSAWMQHYAGGVLYVMFWILVVLAVRPGLSPRRVAIAVFLVTSALEVLQLWHPAWLEALRAPFLGKALLGTTFAWWDFPHYALGAVAAVLLVRRLAPQRRSAPS
jgi:hypothetical protein